MAERATDTNDPVAIAQATQFKTMTATQFLDNISGGQYSTDLKNMESDYGYVVDGSSATWNNIYNAIEMMEGINKMRASRGLGELKIDSTLFYMPVLGARAARAARWTCGWARRPNTTSSSPPTRTQRA